MQKENDTLLVAKLREGNKFAFEALYEKYSIFQYIQANLENYFRHFTAVSE